ncbi:TetR family transcriptional regulator C-terminal domain-containing protein [Actinomadura luteofluorescens]|uniref:TetR family transcriptional regulator C-terminal domain-containing protein n=1 Tax=Actinomadura luteofluorescens TaxID=46163 RepID=UPI003483EE81
MFRVVRRDGLEQASLRTVAAEAGLAIGSVRHSFGGQADIMIFAMRTFAELLPLDDERREEAEVWPAFAVGARTRPELRPLAREMHDDLRAGD